MDGAFGLGEDMLTATYLLNLDTEVCVCVVMCVCVC